MTYVNEKFIQISGYSREELRGQSHRMIKSGEHSPAFYRELWRTIARGRVWRGEVKNRKKNGEHYWAAATIVPFLNPEGKPDRYVAIHTEITARKRAELQARKAEGTALRALEAKGEFLANMSHEIRTPMNGVLGVASLLLDSDLDAEQRDFAQMIHSSGEALLCIINDILDCSKIEAGKLLLEESPVDLEVIVRTAMDLLQAKADDGGIDFRLRYAADAPRGVIADGGRLRQILLNLLSNAIKFTKRGYVEVCVECEAREPGEARIRISVEDTGAGIAADALEQIFDKFVQADASTTRRFGGTGLGLAITKQLVEVMHGSVGVRSQLGVGSTFFVTLPLALALDDTAIQRVGRPAAVDLSPIAARVLLAEDNAINRKVARRMLEKLGCTVDCANDGSECLSLLGRESYDLIFMDVQMPEMDGIEATRTIRVQEVASKCGRPIPIIGLTASAMPGDRERCIEAGMDDYLTKPIKPQNLRRVLEQWCVASNARDRGHGSD